MKKQTILITGGAGYIGSTLAKHLLKNGDRVVILDDLSSGKKQNLLPGEIFYKETLLSKNLYTILKKERPEIIFHLASKKNIEESLSKPMEFSQVNISGSLNLLHAAYSLGIKKIVFTSTAAVYGEHFKKNFQTEDQLPAPISPYGASKLAVEGYIHYYNKFHNMEGVVLRFANVYGKGGETNLKGVIDIFLEKLLRKEQITVFGDGSQVRDFVHVEDVVDMCAYFANSNYKNKTNGSYIFNIATGEGISINKLLAVMQKITKITPKIKYKNDQFFGQKKSILSPLHTKETLKWVSKISLSEGIRQSLRDYANGNMRQQIL